METNGGLTLRSLSDEELLLRLSALVSESHRVEADLVAHIGEVDERKLYARQACPSMFAYCTERLHLSEAEAYRRITVARAARKHPALLPMLRDGRLHLSGLARLVPFLTPENAAALLERATHRTTRQVEQLVAELAPRSDVPGVIRKLPQRRVAAATIAEDGGRAGTLDGELVARRVPGQTAGTLPVFPEATAASPAAQALVLAPTASPTASLSLSSGSTRPASVEPLSPARYKVQFTASAELRDKIERLTALMRSEVPDGDLATVIERAVTEKLERLETRRFGRTAAPRKKLAQTDTKAASRYIPASVRRAVHTRDGSRCRFTDEHRQRCSERRRLELHHRHPYAMGGDHSLANVSLLCAAHNRLLAETDYGVATMNRHSRNLKDAPDGHPHLKPGSPRGA